MAEMKPIEKAILAYNNIIRDPDKWVQDMWHCGTSCCFAGHIGLVCGWRFAPHPDERLSDAPSNYPYMIKDNVTRHVERVAEMELGLEQYHYDNDTPIDLFGSDNGLDDFRSMIERIFHVTLLFAPIDINDNFPDLIAGYRENGTSENIRVEVGND